MANRKQFSEHIDPDIRNRKSKIKVTEEGQACRKCGTPVVKRSHDKPSSAGQAYWFKWWFACPNPRCRTVYMVEEAKVWTSETEQQQQKSERLC